MIRMNKTTKKQKKKVATKEPSAAQKIIAYRQQQVMKWHFVRKYTLQETYDVLKNDKKLKKMSFMTVQRDSDDLQKNFVKQLKFKTADKLILETVNQQLEIIRKAWILYTNTELPSIKIQALKLIQETESKNIGIFERLGLIEKVADRLELEGDMIPSVINIIQPKEKKK